LRKLDHAEEAKLNKLVAVHQKKRGCECEHQQNNQDERHWLQKLVDNGEQLDHDEEAKLNELVAAHQKKRDHKHEHQ
jgi:hypothetical protein